LEMAFSKWYQLPFQLALWEVLETLDQVKLRTLHCDVGSGWVLAEHRTRMWDVGLVEVSVAAHPELGSTVSLSAEPYLSMTRDSMEKAYNDLLRALDYRLNARAHHFSAAVRAAEVGGARLDLDKGTDLGPRAKAMSKPRAMGSLVASVLIGVLFLIPVPLHDTQGAVMLYLPLAAPFFLSAVVIGAGRYAAGGMFLMVAGTAIGLFFSIFTFFLSTAILWPAWKGGSRAIGAEHKRERLATLSEGSRLAPKAIEIEHRYT
jgi:hypothetical protein